MEIDTVPPVTLETFNVRVVPEPDKVPLVAEPVPEVIVKSVATSPVGAALNVKFIEVVVGVPTGVAVQAIGPRSVTVLVARSALPEVMETDTVPAIGLETVNVRVVPVPDKVPLVAEPVPEVIVMFDAFNVPGSAVKLKLISVVFGVPTAVAVQALAISVTCCELLTTPARLMETDTVPALTLETFNVRVVPVPDKVPLVTEPVPEVIVTVKLSGEKPSCCRKKHRFI
ncbi:MAG: hypothetical protein FWD87_08990 [Spirochaetaceae bacterium]|nr:hypothetical protein [Spirochaetaceae bacterium]